MGLFSREKLYQFPKEVDEAIEKLQVTRACLQDVVKYLEKMLRDASKSDSKIEEMEALSKTCEKYMNVFGDCSLTSALNISTTVFSVIGKKEKHGRRECFDHVLTPIKVWVEDDYPRLMKDVDKCHKLHTALENAAQAAQNKPTAERAQKYELAKAEFQRSYEMIKGEVDRMKKVNEHHMNCLKLLTQNHLGFFRFMDKELEKAAEAVIKVVDPGQSNKSSTK